MNASIRGYGGVAIFVCNFPFSNENSDVCIAPEDRLKSIDSGDWVGQTFALVATNRAASK